MPRPHRVPSTPPTLRHSVGGPAPSLLEPPPSQGPFPAGISSESFPVFCGAGFCAIHPVLAVIDCSLIKLISIPESPVAASVPGTYFEHQWIIKGPGAEGTAGLSANRIKLGG